MQDNYATAAEALSTKSYFYEASLSLRPVVLPKYKDKPEAVVVCFKDERQFIYDPSKSGTDFYIAN